MVTDALGALEEQGDEIDALRAVCEALAEEGGGRLPERESEGNTTPAALLATLRRLEPDAFLRLPSFLEKALETFAEEDQAPGAAALPPSSTEANASLLRRWRSLEASASPEAAQSVETAGLPASAVTEHLLDRAAAALQLSDAANQQRKRSGSSDSGSSDSAAATDSHSEESEVPPLLFPRSAALPPFSAALVEAEDPLVALRGAAAAAPGLVVMEAGVGGSAAMATKAREEDNAVASLEVT